MDASPPPTPNPFRGPERATPSLDAPGLRGPRATRAERLWTYLVDTLAQLVVPLGGALVLVLLGADTGHPLFGVALQVAAVIGGVAYYVLGEAVFGRTLGKVLVGTQVFAEDGGPPAPGAVLLRTAVRYVPFEPLSALLGADCRPWHDRLSRTQVVSTRRARKEAWNAARRRRTWAAVDGSEGAPPS